MTKPEEIDYRILIDRLIEDFPAVKRVWPISTQLALFILLETAILASAILLGNSLSPLAVVDFYSYELGAAGFMLVSIAAAWMAMRNAIPGRESSAAEPILLAFGVIAAAVLVRIEPSSDRLFSLAGFASTFVRDSIFAALPWIALFWAARRAMPLRPYVVGGMIGVAASCFAVALDLLSGPPVPFICDFLAAAIIAMLSLIAGAVWLDPSREWLVDGSSKDRSIGAGWFDARVILGATAALAAGLLVFVLRAGTGAEGSVHDFDLAIDNYRQALTSFHPNVPSNSLADVLTAYVDHGMPSYMWDFGPEGFRLAGGRFERLADGTPITYTWFHGTSAGIMCMFRQVNGFETPSMPHYERNLMLFYRYRGYTVCLINVGGYGDYVSVIVSPIPMKPFMRIVTSALS